LDDHCLFDNFGEFDSGDVDFGGIKKEISLADKLINTIQVNEMCADDPMRLFRIILIISSEAGYKQVRERQYCKQVRERQYYKQLVYYEK